MDANNVVVEQHLQHHIHDPNQQQQQQQFLYPPQHGWIIPDQQQPQDADGVEMSNDDEKQEPEMMMADGQILSEHGSKQRGSSSSGGGGKKDSNKISLADLKDCPPGVKPYHAYSTLIRYAIKGSPTGELTVRTVSVPRLLVQDEESAALAARSPSHQSFERRRSAPGHPEFAVLCADDVRFPSPHVKWWRCDSRSTVQASCCSKTYTKPSCCDSSTSGQLRRVGR